MVNYTVSNEKLMDYICNELSSEESSHIKKLLETDDKLKSQYDKILKIRNLHAETMLPLFRTSMPEKTKKLINSLKKSQTKKITKLFSLAPIAIVGWLGFASVGSIQLANIIYDKPDSSNLIIAEKETSNVRTLSDEYGSNKSEQDELISLIKNRYKSFTVGETFIIKNSNKISNTSSKGMSLFFKVKDLSSGNNKICVDFEIKSYISESETIFEQFCFSSQK